MATNETNRMLSAAAAACEDKKAEDIRILALDPAESGLADYFLLCNGTNERQNVAIAVEVELRMKRDFNTLPNSVEGRRQADWILVSFHSHEYGYASLVGAKTHNELSEPADFVRAFARSAIDAGADMFVGHGSHTPLGIEFYKGKPIFY